MTAQEVFDKVIKGLIEQGQKSFSQHKCFYRLETDNGCLKCAVGLLIPDDEYDEKMETKVVAAIYEFDSLSEETRELLETHLDLLGDMQYIHDFREVEEWPISFKNLANQLDLDWKFPKWS